MTRTDLDYSAYCPCGRAADIVWDSGDGPPIDLCAGCYLRRAQAVVDKMMAERLAEQDIEKPRLLVLSTPNRFPDCCFDCGAEVARGAGFRAGVICSARMVTVCEPCSNERMEGR